MSDKNTGGPAFPCDNIVVRKPNGSLSDHVSDPGMTLRDYFAAKAMQALIAHHGDVSSICDRDSRVSLHFAAYDHADRMLEMRDKS